jgi:hypothetical protein
MKIRFYKSIILGSIVLFSSVNLSAGNKDRIGQNGANELSLNPWARTSGMAASNSVRVTGLESLGSNISGLAFTRKTEIIYSYNRFLGGAANINAFGLSQKVGESNVIGLAITNMSFGEIDITTEDKPEGGIGVYSPSFLTVNMAYARAFSNAIYGGIAVKIISESMTNIKSQGVALDVGIRYVTGKDDNLKFGIALRNVGPKMRFTGDGLATKTEYDGKEFTLSQRSEAFEMPAELQIGVTYDFYVGAKTDTTGKSGISAHRITPAGTFVSKSFGKDQVRLGAEYAWKEMVMARIGYMYEEGIWKDDERTTVFTGPTFGATIEYPLGQNGTTIALDYNYQLTNPFAGNHNIGLRLNL